MTLLGIDPGQRGAIAVFDGGAGELIALHDMPTCERGRVDPVALSRLLSGLGANEAWLESVGPRPTDGAAPAFAFGYAYGTIRTVLAMLPEIRTTLVAPSAWTTAMGLRGTSKGDRKALCERYWPGQFARRRADFADAALIGAYGLGQGLTAREPGAM